MYNLIIDLEMNRNYYVCMIKHITPRNWLNYDIHPLIQPLTEAKAAVLSLVRVDGGSQRDASVS